MSSDHLSAAILAGGLGTRLQEVVSGRPKVLAEVRGRPFLSYLLDQLAAAGIRDVVLCTGYRGEQVQDRFGLAYGSLRIAYSEEQVPLGTAGALRLALPLLKSETILVMNGDSFCNLSLSAFWHWHHQRNAQASLVLVRTADAGRFGRVQVDAEGKVTGFEEKSAGGIPGWINAGVYLLAVSRIQTIPEKGAVSLERTMFPAWIREGVYGYQCPGSFLDIGTPESYAAADRFFLQETRA